MRVVTGNYMKFVSFDRQQEILRSSRKKTALTTPSARLRVWGKVSGVDALIEELGRAPQGTMSLRHRDEPRVGSLFLSLAKIIANGW